MPSERQRINHRNEQFAKLKLTFYDMPSIYSDLVISDYVPLRIFQKLQFRQKGILFWRASLIKENMLDLQQSTLET